MSLTCNGQAFIFLSLINYCTTYRAHPVSVVFFHIGRTAAWASRRYNDVLEFIHIVVLIMA
jgi:hypothetical protein